MKKTIAILLLVPGLAFAADAAKGKDLYSAKCKGCHAADGAGNPGMVKAMGMHALGSKEVQAKSDADLKKVVTDGMGKMKPVAGVTGADLDNVIAFVRTLKQ